MPADHRLSAQINLILEAHPRAVVVPENWGDTGEVDYIYRPEAILTHERDVDRVVRALRQILTDPEQGGLQVPDGEQLPFEREEGPAEREEGPVERRWPVRVSAGIVSLPVPPARISLPDILDILDGRLWPAAATLDHLLYLVGYPCPATEAIPVPGTVDPFPLPGLNARCTCSCRRIPWPECDGDGVSVSIVDTGLIDGADSHPWLAGVQGKREDPYYAGTTNIKPYAGHGTFAAGIMRCMAPKASAYVEAGFNIDGAGAASCYESMLPPSLEHALDRNPDILVFTFCTSTRRDRPLIIFEDFYRRRIRHLKGLAVLAPAGNDGWDRRMWPAASHEVISVGALAADWRNRAHYSNHGKWVGVYAPGTDLINAYPTGTFETNELPQRESREFQGMAMWSGTSFSTPLVAGMIAARMSATGENAQQAADSLMRLACGQAVPGVGAVLYPGQACCQTGRCNCH